ncbi:MAG: POTRA domain-containing protein [Elusimicrobia bacterium]|nr:POTRA domain-containing protein [Elusimicrobiota bacterium]
MKLKINILLIHIMRACILSALLLISILNTTYGLTPDEQRALEQQKVIEQKESMEKQSQELRKIQDEIELKRKTKELEAPKPERLRKSDIRELQRKLQNLYLNHGYISARVYLDIKDPLPNTLKFTILEGTIENIYFADPNQGKMPIRTAFPRLRNKTLNIRDIEQGFEQMNRLQSNNATMQIKPGKTDGGAEIEIMNTPGRRTRVSYGANNSGTELTGQNKHFLDLLGENLFRLNEMLSLNYGRGFEDNDRKYARNYGSSLSVPLGYWTFDFNYNASEYLATIQGISGNIFSKNDYNNLSFSVDRVLSRARRHKINAGLGLTSKESKGYLNGVKLDVSSRNLIPMSVYASHLIFLPGGLLSSRVSYIHGLDILDAQEDRANLAEGQPKAQFQAVSLNEYFSYRFALPYTNIPLTYSINLTGQYSWDDLFSSEQFTPNVRGYREGGICGESGASASNDIQTPLIGVLPFKNKTARSIITKFSLNCFYDKGFVQHKTYGGKEHISGWGYGISGKLYDIINMNIYVSNPLEAPSNVTKERNAFNMSLNIVLHLV